MFEIHVRTDMNPVISKLDFINQGFFTKVIYNQKAGEKKVSREHSRIGFWLC